MERHDLEQQKNIMLIGMPGCGKSTVGGALARRLRRRLVDLDEEIVKEAGRPIPEIFATDGEEYFRQLEHRVLEKWAGASGLVISTGGGIVTRPENLPLLRLNSRVVFLERDLSRLPVNGRPVSQAHPLEELYEKRFPLYVKAADLRVSNSGTVRQAVNRVIAGLNLQIP